MAFTKTRLSAANPAVANRFVTSTNMANGAYALANTTMPTTPGARRLTVTTVTVTGADTMGTITFVGTDIRGNALTEVIVPLAGATATGTRFFVTVTSATQAGWIINTGNDTITIGAEAGSSVIDTGGQLYAIVVNTTAAGTITLTDGSGAFAILKASIAENTYYFECDIAAFLNVTLAAASDVTVIHSNHAPASYAG